MKIEIKGTKFKVGDEAYVLRDNGTNIIAESVRIKSVTVTIKREDATLGGGLIYTTTYTVGAGHNLGILKERELFVDKQEAVNSLI